MMKAGAVPAQPDPDDVSRITYRWDRVRGGSFGLLETFWNTLSLLIAIRVFDASTTLKPWLQASHGAGLILAGIMVPYVRRLNLRVTDYVMLLWIGVAAVIALSGFGRSAWIFIGAIALSRILFGQGVPIMTHVYSANYSSRERGARLSTSFIISALSGIVFGYLAGELLDVDNRLYPVLLGVAVAATLVGAFSIHRMPSIRMNELRAGNVLQNVSLAWKDKLFGWMLTAWMLMGLGNLMLLPIRTEYMANSEFGINASNAQVTLILVGVVSVFRLISTKVWGFLFDRMNLITMRVILNTFFFLSIAVFFNTTSLYLMALGAAFLGIAFGGGGIMWTLWVTKIAAPDEAYAYMSVHGFFTGMRMLIAPFLGYAMLDLFGPVFAAWISLAVIALSTIMFLPMRKALQERARATG